MIERYEVLDTRRQVTVESYINGPGVAKNIERWARSIVASEPHLQVQFVTHTGQRSIINERGKSNVRA